MNVAMLQIAVQMVACKISRAAEAVGRCGQEYQTSQLK